MDTVLRLLPDQALIKINLYQSHFYAAGITCPVNSTANEAEIQVMNEVLNIVNNLIQWNIQIQFIFIPMQVFVDFSVIPNGFKRKV